MNKIPPAEYAQVAARYRAGETQKQIAASYGVSASSISKVLLAIGERARTRQEICEMRGEAPPTPEEIRERAEEVRRRWPDEEYYRRAGIRRRPYEIPECRAMEG